MDLHSHVFRGVSQGTIIFKPCQAPRAMIDESPPFSMFGLTTKYDSVRALRDTPSRYIKKIRGHLESHQALPGQDAHITLLGCRKSFQGQRVLRTNTVDHDDVIKTYTLDSSDRLSMSHLQIACLLVVRSSTDSPKFFIVSSNATLQTTIGAWRLLHAYQTVRTHE